MAKKRIFIDTDAGTDDAVAIIMALQSPNIEVVGISCVGGNTSVNQVAQNVLSICAQLKVDVSVYLGADKPKSRPLKPSDFIHGIDGLGDLNIDNHSRQASTISAIDALKNCIELYPNELTIVTLGPMTNLAEALAKFPEMAGQIKSLLIMGGTYQMPGNITPVSEYNFWADPEAAQYCIELPIQKRIIGWDITLNAGYLTMDELQELKNLNSKLAQTVYDMQQIRLGWMLSERQELKCTWADAAAMSSLLQPKYISNYGHFYCQISLSHDDDDTRGMLIVDINNQKKLAPNAEIALGANRDVFKELIFKAFKAYT